MPAASIVLNTFNRSDLLPQAVRSIQDQRFEDWELIIVDDGSTDDTPAVIAGYDDSRIRSTGHENMGLTASRNAGAALAVGEWLAFLDDDDGVADTWLEELLEAATVTTGIVFCGHAQVDLGGRELNVQPLRQHGASMGDAVGSILPGTWIMRRTVFEAAGGYLDGFPFAHQNELLIRAIACSREMSLQMAAVDRPLFRYTVRPSDDRPMLRPRLAIDGGRWFVCRHREALKGDPVANADLEGIIGVAAAREGHLGLAQRHLWRAVRARPTDPKRWMRLVASLSPAATRRLWRPYPEAATRRSPLCAVHELPPAHQKVEDHYFLPWRYRRNPQASADSAGTPYWEEPSKNSVLYQEPVYRAARRLVQKHDLHSVLDVGTGSGIKLEQYLMPVAAEVTGLDQGSAITLARSRCPDISWVDGDLMEPETWEALQVDPDLVICADVIEHVEDPVQLLRGIRSKLRPGARLLISTPDRLRYDVPDPLGPPGNARHVREWTRDEFELLLESCGFRIASRHRYLPRGYRPTVLELKRQVWRLLHGRRLPDRRSNAAWVCQLADEPSR